DVTLRRRRPEFGDRRIHRAVGDVVLAALRGELVRGGQGRGGVVQEPDHGQAGQREEGQRDDQDRAPLIFGALLDLELHGFLTVRTTWAWPACVAVEEAVNRICCIEDVVLLQAD